MKKILTSNIITPVKQPFTRTSLEWIQQAYQESINYLSNSNVITRPAYLSGGVGQKIYGCTPVTVTLGIFHTIPAGVIKFGDILYKVDATNAVSITSPNVPVCYAVASYASTDPILLSDGSTENVHQYEKIIVTGGTSGIGGSANPDWTYLCDFYDVLEAPEVAFLDDLIPYALSASTSASISAETGWSLYYNACYVDSFGYLNLDFKIGSNDDITSATPFVKVATLNSILPDYTPYFGNCTFVNFSTGDTVLNCKTTPFTINNVGEILVYDIETYIYHQIHFGVRIKL